MPDSIVTTSASAKPAVALLLKTGTPVGVKSAEPTTFRVNVYETRFSSEGEVNHM